MNKYALLLIGTLTMSIISNAQEAMSIGDAYTSGINLAELDSLYKSAINADKSKAVFSEQQNEYVQAYYAMLHELSIYLNQNEFKWGGQIRCFNKIYFAADGSIDYFLYDFKEGELTSEQEGQFHQLLSQFIKTYKFELSADMKFAQCSPVNYRDSI